MNMYCVLVFFKFFSYLTVLERGLNKISLFDIQILIIHTFLFYTYCNIFYCIFRFYTPFVT